MENKVIKLAEGMVALSFSTEPNPAVIDAVRTILLNHYAQTKEDSLAHLPFAYIDMIILLRAEAHMHLENCIFRFFGLKHELARSAAI